MIRFACPGCSATFSVEDEKAGKAGKCPKCQSQFVIPTVTEAESPPPLPPPSPFDGGGQQPPPLPVSFVPTPPADPNAPVEVRPCPKCQSRLSVLPADVGGEVSCPKCETTFKAVRADAPPPPSPGRSKSGGSLVRLGSGSEKEDDEDDRDRNRRRSRRDDDDRDRPSRRRYDDDDDRDRPRRSRRGSGYGCPSCGSDARPLYRSEISTGGWVVFALMLTFCFPLFWIGLLMKEEYRVCADCGRRL